MAKLFWVALPLLLVAALVALQALRGRLPSRTALNVGSSLLLLAYLLCTASLGIFWVANQQLPVFDWHYLFGYGTVLLVGLHLVFNFPSVWRWLKRRGAPGRPAQTPLAAGRRGALGAVGGLTAAAAAFLLGMRHGRSELRIEVAAGGAGAPAADAAAASLVERFHQFSSHSRGGVLLRAPAANWGEAPPPYKRYPGAPRRPLALPARPSGKGLDQAALATALWHTMGITERRGGLELRASPSSGALFATELYLAARSVAGIEAGLWHYDPPAHALERIGDAAAAEALLAAGREASFGTADAALVATAVFRRTGQKYRDRTYRYVLADLGHALENLRVAAIAAGLAPTFAAAFDEARLARAIGIDENEEGVLAMLALGPVKAGVGDPRLRADAFERAAAPAVGAPLPTRWQPPPLPAGAAPLGITAAVHAATSLRAAAAEIDAGPASVAAPVALPPVALQPADWLALIATRRSVRRFEAAPLRIDELAAVLDRLMAPGPALSPALRVDVVVHAVAGLTPGSYRFDPLRRALLPRRFSRELRSAARAAALDQDVIGDAAAVLVISADRNDIAADPLGPARGYRHAFLEAGLLGERVYLEAGLHRLGVCAVGAFYDAEAAALVALEPEREWVLHFAAIGVPPGRRG